MRLNTSIQPQVQLQKHDREAMFQLYSQHYSNLKRDVFFQDLAAKDWTIMLCDNADEVAGFSTVEVIDLPGYGRFLFSGDTIVEPHHWFNSQLAAAFGLLMRRYMVETAAPLYWFLISKGYRTYRFLPTYFHEFAPRFDKRTSLADQTVLDAIARHKFGRHYDPATGIISFDGKKDHVNLELCSASCERTRNPHIDYFLCRNPGFRRGDELACLARIAEENLRPIAKRVIAASTVEWCA